VKRVWLVGPISWDTVIEIDTFPINGGFAQGRNRKERAGGSAANTAIALASTDVESHLITFVGNDEIGKKLLANLANNSELRSHVETIPGPSLHALITLDKSGERTVFALEENRLSKIDFQFKFDINDIVCFPVWRNFYLPWLDQVKQQGAFTVVGLSALSDELVSADLAIGSQSDLSGAELHLNRIPKVIITKGEEGSLLIDNHTEISVTAFPVDAKDLTGAGDAYLAGVLFALASNKGLEEGMKMGSRWAAACVELDSSIPPSWSDVCRRFGL